MSSLDTGPAPLDSGAHRRRVVWDPTINVTHVVNFALGLIAVVGVYYNLDGRLSRQEDRNAAQIASRAEKDAQFQNAIATFGGELKELRTAVDKVGRAIDVQNAINEVKEKRK